MQYEKPAVESQVSLEGSLDHRGGELKPIRRGSGRAWVPPTQ